MGSEIQIGGAAGQVWILLNENGPQTLAQIKDKLKLTGDITGFALGWLAREGKIDITEEKRGFRVQLK